MSNPVKVVKHGDLHRVAEADGSWVMHGRFAADEGGFLNEKDAVFLAAKINERRAVKREVAPVVAPVPDVVPVPVPEVVEKPAARARRATWGR